MTEKEKMLSYQPYCSMDEELLQERQIAKQKIYELNQLNPKEIEKREDIIKSLFGKIGKNFFIEPPFYCDYGYNVTIGDNFYSNYHCTILDCAKVRIGNNVMFGPNVSIYTAGHPVDKETRNAGLEYAYDITIGNDVWIGGNTVILPNVTIGDDVVIGAGSIVTKDIPSHCVAVGNPCHVLRSITEEDKKIRYCKK